MLLCSLNCVLSVREPVDCERRKQINIVLTFKTIKDYENELCSSRIGSFGSYGGNWLPVKQSSSGDSSNYPRIIRGVKRRKTI